MSLSKSCCWLCVWIFLFPTHLTVATEHTKSPQVTIRFCAPQNDVYPFFITQNQTLTGINPDFIRQMFDTKHLPNVSIEFVRRPWKRCNTDLEKGEVDMMIGGFDNKRKSVVYPSDIGFSIEQAALSTAEVCFSTLDGEQMANTRRGIAGKSTFTVGIEAGFSQRHGDDINPKWVVLYNPTEKYRMLEKGRVDAIVEICAMDSVFPIKTNAKTKGFNDVITMYPPYLSNPAYVIFSKAFAQRHPTLTKRIVRRSLDFDKSDIYFPYQPSTLQSTVKRQLNLSVSPSF